MTEDKVTKADLADLLMKEYALLKQEILLMLGYYKSHVKYFQIVVTGIIAMFALITKENFETISNSRIFWIGVMFAITTVVSYIIFDVLESQYSLVALGSRMAELENRLNSLIESKPFIWETALVKALYSRPIPMKGVIHPDLFLNAYLLLLVTAGLFAVPIYFIFNFWSISSDYFEAFRILVVFDIVYSLFSIVIVVYTAIGILFTFRENVSSFVKEETERFYLSRAKSNSSSK